MENKTKLETVAGAFSTNIAVNAIAAVAPLLLTSVTPLVTLLPFLVNSLAVDRQTKRIEVAIQSLSVELSSLALDISTITDDQYKLAGECSMAFLSTVSEVKLAYLKQAVVNSLLNPELSNGVSDALSRVVRDVSAAEAEFVIKSFQFKGVFIDAEMQSEPDKLVVQPDSDDEIIVGGLIQLGLLYSRAATWDASMYEWSPLTAKFIVLVGPTTP